MNHDSFLVIANWKMNMTFSRSIEFAQQHGPALMSLSKQYSADIVLCPSYPVLSTLAAHFNETPIAIGAQNCSAHCSGAYTGQVDAPSLKQAGARYTIVGHSESRIYFSEDNRVVEQKIIRLLEQKIIPIVCIGETANEHQQQVTKQVLAQQLEAVFTATTAHKPQTPIIIAYEPVWAIGTGITPDAAYLTEIAQWIMNAVQPYAPALTTRLIYGGSVDSENVPMIVSIPNIGGLLMGGASLDFQKFQKIVSLTKNS